MTKRLMKNLMLVLAVVMLCFAVGVTASAENWGDYEYIVLDDGTVEISQYMGNESKVEIPSEIDGMSVSSIGERAFFDCHSFTELIIADTVKTIGNHSFGRCLRMENVTIPVSVTYISKSAFVGCASLKQLSIPGNVKVMNEYAFSTCFGLTEVTIDVGTEAIGYGAFSILPFLEKITVKSMDVDLFEESLCSNASTVEGISRDDFVDLAVQCMITNDEELWLEFESYTKVSAGTIYIGTIYCHEGSTAEAYAIENGAPYELTHFFEGDWIYDSENKNFYRQCIHCDEREISEDMGDIEIEAPVIPDTDFTVDVVEDYVIIEETISNNVTVDFEIIKAFDINLKNKDGVHVQPDGSVKVKLPNDWSKSGVYKVYRVNDDGTLTDMNAYRQGSHLVFDTDHFSVYVIVVEDEAPSEPEAPETKPDEEVKDNFFTRLIDLIKAFFKLIKDLFNK